MALNSVTILISCRKVNEAEGTSPQLSSKYALIILKLENSYFHFQIGFLILHAIFVLATAVAIHRPNIVCKYYNVDFIQCIIEYISSAWNV